MIGMSTPELDFRMHMNRKWPGRICRVAARLIFLLIVLHNLHKLVS